MGPLWGPGFPNSASLKIVLPDICPRYYGISAHGLNTVNIKIYRLHNPLVDGLSSTSLNQWNNFNWNCLNHYQIAWVFTDFFYKISNCLRISKIARVLPDIAERVICLSFAESWEPWGRQDIGGPHVGPVNFAIWGLYDTDLGCVGIRRHLCFSFKI